MQDRKTLAKKETAKSDRGQAVSADLIAVVIAVTNGEPRVLTIGQAPGFAIRTL